MEKAHAKRLRWNNRDIMYNFNLEPLRTEIISQGSLFIELPVYEDLLGSEYDLIQEIESEEMLWNSKIVELTERLAKHKNMLMLDVVSLLNEAENAGDSHRIALLGEFFPEFVQLLNTKPKSKDVTLRLITEICRRANSDITIEDIAKLPKGFVGKLRDFALREQLGSETDSYKDLLLTKQKFELEFNKARALIDEIYKLNGVPPHTNKSKNVKESIEAYYLSFNDVGK